jgi:hypothetical protein
MTEFQRFMALNGADRTYSYSRHWANNCSHCLRMYKQSQDGKGFTVCQRTLMYMYDGLENTMQIEQVDVGGRS